MKVKKDGLGLFPTEEDEKTSTECPARPSQAHTKNIFGRRSH